MFDINKIYYSTSGIPQYYKSLLDIINIENLNNFDEIHINTSLQPNSIPHIGTVTTLMCVFELAKQIQIHFNKKTTIQIDLVDCCYFKETYINDKRYVKSINRMTNKLSNILPIYYELFDWLKTHTNTNYKVFTYNDFIINKNVRKCLVKIVNSNKIKHILSTKDNKLHIRAECPKCHLIDKTLSYTEIKNIGVNGFEIVSFCPIHGKYNKSFSIDNKTYVEINSQLRDLIKCYIFDCKKSHRILTIMCDGGDWGGTWPIIIERAINILDSTQPIRLFCPLIVDETGGKLSKSFFLNDNQKSEIKKGFSNYIEFKSMYGDYGLEKLFMEVRNWIAKPSHFFRNYSVEYINKIISQGDLNEN